MNFKLKSFLVLSILAIAGCNSEPLIVSKESNLGVLEFSGTVSPLNNWGINCAGQDKITPARGADKGTVTYSKSDDTWTFTKSRNYCQGGFFEQRAELITSKISPKSNKSYLFETDFSFTSESNERFSIFSLHDTRDGCAPPAQLHVNPDGRIWIASDVKVGAGEQCIRGRLGTSSSARILRDGTEQNLRVLVNFDGDGGFLITVWLDGKRQFKEKYSPQKNGYKSKTFHFNHGVYSQAMFDYIMKSRNVKVAEVIMQNSD